LTLAGLGNQVSFAFLPYTRWQENENLFDLKRQNLYIKRALKPAASLLDIASFWKQGADNCQSLPSQLSEAIRDTAAKDVKYSLMREEVDLEGSLFQLRLKRNRQFGEFAYSWMQENHPDVVIIPNGSILEFAVLYQVSRYLEIPVVTYEFGEQQDRIWIARDREVMDIETDPMWEVYEDQELTEPQWEQMKSIVSARQGGDLLNTFTRKWQDSSRSGEELVRRQLELDERPVVFIPTNVLGDSLTLGREIFSKGMMEWIVRTIHFFEKRRDVQLIIRVHPGERLGWGASLVDVIGDFFPRLPENIYIIPAEDSVNSYDIVEIASFAVVFTTTMGLEMAMSGKPVIVVGKTHYRGKGFTYDPDTWEEYFGFLSRFVDDPRQGELTEGQVRRAWTYAYRYFFNYPFPFPWHVQQLWKDVERWPLHRVLSEQGLRIFRQTFQYFQGETVQWAAK
jgi:hypothetical protein